MYLLAHGDVLIADKAANGVLNVAKAFHCPNFELEVSAEYAEHKNSTGIIRVRDARVATEMMAKLAMTLDVHDPVVLAMCLGGQVTTDAGTSFSGKAFPSGLQVGDTIPIPGNFVNLGSLTIVDSAGTPATLTLGTHYTADLVNGTITIINLGSFVQPFKASGASAAAGKIVSIATQTTVEKFIRLRGTNLDDLKPIIVDIYRAQIPPVKIPIKTDGNDFAKFEFAPEVLADPSAPFSAQFGQYGRYVTT